MEVTHTYDVRDAVVWCSYATLLSSCIYWPLTNTQMGCAGNV